jgi:hypothetical protein
MRDVRKSVRKMYRSADFVVIVECFASVLFVGEEIRGDSVDMEQELMN